MPAHQHASVTVRAGAKVNPLLAIHGRRGDGFHELTTLMLGVDLCDDVTVTCVGAGETVEVLTSGPQATPDIPTDATNLAARGALAAMAALGVRADLRIEITKGIPSRAGLGGGSSDAAAAALGVLELFGQGNVQGRLEESVIRALGELGADCAFFFAARSAGAALARGRGERVQPIVAEPQWHLALITPQIDCATPAVYGALGLEAQSAADIEKSRVAAALPQPAELLQRAALGARKDLMNDLETAAGAAFPDLKRWRTAFGEAGHPHFVLAGSGSSFFGVFDSLEEADRASEDVLAAAASQQLGVRFAGVVQPSGPSLLQVLDRSQIPSAQAGAGE